MGGLGIPLHADTCSDIYQAAKAAAEPIIQRIMGAFSADQTDSPTFTRASSLDSAANSCQTPQEVLKQAQQKRLALILGQLPTAAKGLMLENASYLGRKWLQVLPTQKHLTFADLEATEAIRSRLQLPVRPLDTPCSYCGSCMQLSHEDTCKGASRRWIARHNQLNRAIITTLEGRPDNIVEKEPIVGQNGSCRTDFSLITAANSCQHFDLQVVAINKPSAKDSPLDTLAEAAAEKRRKYSELGAYFQPLIISAGGLMEATTAKAWKQLQTAAGPAANWLDSWTSVILAKTRAISAASIAKNSPKNSWQATRQQLQAARQKQASQAN